MNGPRWCLKSLPRSPSTPPVLPWKPPQKPMTSCLPVAALARRRAASRFGAAREELDAREAVGREARQQLEQLRAGLGGEAAKGQLLDLALEALDVMRMAVADTAHADAGDEIDVRVAVHVGERAALAAGHGQPRVEREGLQPGRDVTLLALEDLARARPDFAATVGHRDTAANRRAR